jgi:hypothetical protein
MISWKFRLHTVEMGRLLVHCLWSHAKRSPGLWSTSMAASTAFLLGINVDAYPLWHTLLQSGYTSTGHIRTVGNPRAGCAPMREGDRPSLLSVPMRMNIGRGFLVSTRADGDGADGPVSRGRPGSCRRCGRKMTRWLMSGKTTWPLPRMRKSWLSTLRMRESRPGKPPMHGDLAAEAADVGSRGHRRRRQPSLLRRRGR